MKTPTQIIESRLKTNALHLENSIAHLEACIDRELERAFDSEKGYALFSWKFSMPGGLHKDAGHKILSHYKRNGWNIYQSPSKMQWLFLAKSLTSTQVKIIFETLTEKDWVEVQ